MHALFSKLIKREKKRLALILLLLILDTIAQSLLPIIMSSLINASTTSKGISIPLAMQMLCTILLSGAMSVAVCFLSIRSAQNCQNKLRKDAYSHLLTLSPLQVKQFSLGELLTLIMSDSGIVADFFMQVIFVLVKPMLLIVSGAALLMTINFGMLNVVWAILPVQLLLLFVTIRKMLPQFSRMQTHVSKINSHIKSSLNCIRMVKAYNGEKKQTQGFAANNNQMYEDSISIQMWTVMLNPTIMLLINLATMLMLMQCSSMLQQQAVDVGGVMAGFAYIQQIFMSLMMLGEFFPNVSRVRISVRRLTSFFAEKPSMLDGKTVLADEAVSIEMNTVSFRFAEDAPDLLKDMSLSLPQGTHLAIAGSTGSGKSTVLRLLCRLMDATSGEVLVNGRPIAEYKTESLFDQIQIVEQNCRLFPASLGDNIRCGYDATDDQVLQAAATAQLLPLINALPEGLNTFLSESSASLSGGQRQCIAIARALLRKPRVLLMDDCSSSLDLETEFRLMNDLISSYGNMTLVVISQRISTLRRFDRIAMLANGQLVSSGDHETMYQECAAYRRLCEAQYAEEGRS